MIAKGPEYNIFEVFPNQREVQEAYAHLVGLLDDHRNAGKALLTASNGAQMLVDLLFYGLTNRSCNVCDAVLILVVKRNFVAAAPLVRIQMDTLLRRCYMRTLKDSVPFAEYILSGGRMDKRKDADGKFLTDARLRDYARPRYPWIDKTYEELSRLVHFSDAHIYSSMSPLKPDGSNTIHIGVGQTEESWPASEVKHLLHIMILLTEGILAHLYGWAKWKNDNYHPARE